MKSMYAVKCLYQAAAYSKEGELLEELMPCWEERIILIRASSMDEADKKCKNFAKEYESDFVNTDGHLVKVRLYTVIDLFEISDTNARTNIEVYSKMFHAAEEDVNKMLDVEYPIKEA